MKRTRRLGLALAIVAGAGALAVVVLVAFARSSSPTVPLEGDPEHEDEAALRDLFHAVGDPRRFDDGQEVTVTLSDAQVRALAAAASRRRQRVSARARLDGDALEVSLSAETPRARWLSPYVNLEARVTGPANAPRIERARLGSLPIPARLGQALFDWGLREAQRRDEAIAAAVRAVEELTIADGSMTVRVRWTEALREQLSAAGREIIADELGGDRLAPYFAALREALAGALDEDTRPLVAVLPRLFTVARARVAAGEDARRELEAAIVTLTVHGLSLPLEPVLGEQAERLPHIGYVLHERTDLSLHFLVSATATLLAERAVADALGLAKELRDRDDADGSGFSFADLAADRAGVRLMEEGTRSPARLTALLARLAQPLEDADLVPAVAELPEGMDADAFRRAYGDVESEAYRALVATIDRDIAACGAHRALARAGR